MQPAELRRHKERGRYDAESIGSVFSDTFMAHVSYVDHGLPQCLPMIALFRCEEEGEAVYLHGHPSSRLMELVRANEVKRKARIERGEIPDESGDDRIKVCITATKGWISTQSRLQNAYISLTSENLVDGLSLSSAPNGHTFNYRSAVVHGACSHLGDRRAKEDVMRGMMDHIVAGRWEDLNPLASFALSLVFVIRVQVQRGSMKHQSGIPMIQSRDRAKDGPDRQELVWTGVVPLYEHLGAPVPSGLTDDAQIPEGLLKYIRERNEKQEGYARSAAK
ncbi:flavin-nucleotide-binding protein [Blastomyces gilchristii SLH14081]|uniref:Flavin-nucleotide-binding protein n=1 Tax=Blastomyces gilchristii (strain SLH14081) TaxID=559298 RepID=A0A179V4G4_BLAGS|nr:flavin-nucleotide-binding protein [Blastomyces gilchristii SLH14081]OAT13492.1 flavin-nucleotide-binding protein [Blastomyces gilchristii SLH14081]